MIPNFTDEDLTEDFMPQLPQLSHVACIDPVWYRPNQAKGGKMKATYPLSPIKRRIQLIISRMRSAAPSRDTPIVLRLVITGTDRVLHSCICAYLALLVETPETFEGIDMKWYVVPFDDNLYASYIARHDGWYK